MLDSHVASSLITFDVASCIHSNGLGAGGSTGVGSTGASVGLGVGLGVTGTGTGAGGVLLSSGVPSVLSAHIEDAIDITSELMHNPDPREAVASHQTQAWPLESVVCEHVVSSMRDGDCGSLMSAVHDSIEVQSPSPR